MAATRYSQYFNIDEKYYAVVTKELIDRGAVKWEGFYPHATFIELLHQVTDMLSGKENKSIFISGPFGTGKSHAVLTVKCLLEASEAEVRAYFRDFGLKEDLCNRFLAARSEEMNGRLIVVHRIGSSGIKNDDDLVWAIQEGISQALEAAGIHNAATGTIKDALIDWVNARAANREYLAGLVADAPQRFGGMDLDRVLDQLGNGGAKTVEGLIANLNAVCRENHILAMNMNPEKLATWIREVIDVNHLGAIVFIWDEFSEFFTNCRNSLTGFQTLAELSHSIPFYFLLVTHQIQTLLPNENERKKIMNRFIEPHIEIELPDNMAFQLMAQAMKETDDPVMLAEWRNVKAGLNNRLGRARSVITEGARKHAKAGEKTLLRDEDLQKIVPLHPYAALVLKHISSLFTGSQRSMFDFIVARDPDEDGGDDDAIRSRAFKWFINHHGVMEQDSIMTVDMLWDFFNAKAGGGMNADALNILNNFEMLKTEFHLTPDEQRVLRTILLMNAICTRVADADMLIPTYENIDLAFLGTGWAVEKALNIAKALVHREPVPVLFEEPLQDGRMRVIPKAMQGGVEIESIKSRMRVALTTRDISESAGLAQALKLPDNLSGHFSVSMLFVNPRSASTFASAFKEPRNRAQNDPDHFELCILTAMTDEERSEAGGQIARCLKDGIPANLLLLDATTNTFQALIEGYITNMAYSEYYQKSDKKQSGQFASYAQKNLANWKDSIASGEFRLYDMAHVNGQQRTGFANICTLLQEIDRAKYPFGLEHYSVTATMFTRSAMGQGAECGLTQTEKGSFTSGNPSTKLSRALEGAWKRERYWEDGANQGRIIVKLKQRVEETIAAGFERNGRIDVIEIIQALMPAPYGLTPNNLSAFVMGFLLKEYANDQYFWSMNNNVSRPMSVDLMKAAIKNAMDQIAMPKANFRPEAIVTMTGETRGFLKATAKIFRTSEDKCGSVEAAAGVIRVGMKRLEFPIWCLKSILDTERLATDTGIVGEVIDKYLGIANIRNYVGSGNVSESDLATEIGTTLCDWPALADELAALMCSDKCKAGMRAYLEGYRGGELPRLAREINDGGNYIAEVKKRFNADEANWVWSPETANGKIDDVITDYAIIRESNGVLAKQCGKMSDCMSAWRNLIDNFHISLEAMAAEVQGYKELLDMLFDLRVGKSGEIPDMKRARFLELLRARKNDFRELYSHQEAMFRRITRSMTDGLTDEDISEVYKTIPTGMFCETDTKYFNLVEARIKAYVTEQRSTKLRALWRGKTGTETPYAWSEKYLTPILCMFDDQERQKAKEIFAIIGKARSDEGEIENATAWLNAGDFYDRLADAAARDAHMAKYVLGEKISTLLPDLAYVRTELKKVPGVTPYEWLENSIIRRKLNDLADKAYKTGGKGEAESYVSELSQDELVRYVKELLSRDMDVGIAIIRDHRAKKGF